MPCLALGAWVPLTLHDIAVQEAEHARFYETGASINTFLKAYCAALAATFESGSGAAVASLYAPRYRAPARAGWRWQPRAAEGVVARWALASDPHGDPGDREQAVAEIVGYLQGLDSMAHQACKIDLIEEAEHDRRVTMTVKLVLGGVDRDGQRVEDRSFHRWTVVREGDRAVAQGWRIVGESLVHGVRVAGDGASFAPVPAASLGIDYAHRRDPALDRTAPDSGLRFAMMGHASGGLAVADVDADGWPDLFFPDGVDSRLYRHRGLDEVGLPQFEDITTAAGLDGVGAAQSALFGDVDGDGDLDLFVARYLAPSKLFVNQGDTTFVDRSAAWGVDLAVPASSSTLLDFDRDGDLDLYLGVYGDAFAAIPRLPFYADNGEANHLFENVGDHFVDVTDRAGVGDSGWSLAVAAGDVDGDGWTDLAVANDFGKKTLYRNRGDGRFEDVTRAAGVLDFSGGMGLAFGDLDRDGDADLYTSNIKSNQRWYGEDMTLNHYLRNVVRTRWALLDAPDYARLYRLLDGRWSGLGKQIGEGNSLFQNRGDGTFEERHDSQTNQAGWSWGVVLADFDNDLDLDLYAANGWISDTPGTDL